MPGLAFSAGRSWQSGLESRIRPFSGVWGVPRFKVRLGCTELWTRLANSRLFASSPAFSGVWGVPELQTRLANSRLFASKPRL